MALSSPPSTKQYARQIAGRYKAGLAVVGTCGELLASAGAHPLQRWPIQSRKLLRTTFMCFNERFKESLRWAMLACVQAHVAGRHVHCLQTPGPLCSPSPQDLPLLPGLLHGGGRPTQHQLHLPWAPWQAGEGQQHAHVCLPPEQLLPKDTNEHATASTTYVIRADSYAVQVLLEQPSR